MVCHLPCHMRTKLSYSFPGRVSFDWTEFLVLEGRSFSFLSLVQAESRLWGKLCLTSPLTHAHTHTHTHTHIYIYIYISIKCLCPFNILSAASPVRPCLRPAPPCEDITKCSLYTLLSSLHRVPTGGLPLKAVHDYRLPFKTKK